MQGLCLIIVFVCFPGDSCSGIFYLMENTKQCLVQAQVLNKKICHEVSTKDDFPCYQSD